MIGTLPVAIHRTAIEDAARCDGYSTDREGYEAKIHDAALTARDSAPEGSSWPFTVCGANLTAREELRKGQYVLAVRRTIHVQEGKQ